MAAFAQVANDETDSQEGVPDLSALLFEIDDAWSAMHHGRNRSVFAQLT